MDSDPEQGEARRSAHRHLHRRALLAARQAVFAMRASDEIGDDAFHQLEEELDWIEMAGGGTDDAPGLISRSQMPSEREKMLAGELYDPLDADLVAARARARDLCQALNATREADAIARRRILVDLFGAGGDTGLDAAAVLLRLRLEYRARRAGVLQLQLRRARRVPRARSGTSRSSARRCRSIRRCIRSTRSCGAGRSSASRSTIGSDVWVGGGAIICPACASARARSSAPGAWSRGMCPEGVFAAGNPCRVMREITE